MQDDVMVKYYDMASEVENDDREDVADGLGLIAK